MMRNCALYFAAITLFACPGRAQMPDSDSAATVEGGAVTGGNAVLPSQERVPGQPEMAPDRHAFGVLPNYGTAEGDLPFSPLTVRQKWSIATSDTLDGPSFLMAGVFAGLGLSADENPSFGHGLKGYAHRYVTAVADQDIGNYMTEAILPTIFHRDPRYFRRGHGSMWVRVGWAVSRVAVARNDAGRWTFNIPECLGNGITASIANSYYPDQVGFGPTMERMFTQIGTDAVSQVLKEFWPDVKRKWLRQQSTIEERE
ncbi:MAG TPA: hypothetical protein VHB50_06215 [Bryobacteraceae bacterium]|nr:hypothetical protein [Bryobacteraceae bacterium]